MPGSTRTAAYRNGGCQRSAFSLLEILVVLAVVGLLLALLLPALSAARGIARDTACLANHRQFATAWSLYFADYDRFPVRSGQQSALDYNWGGVHFYGRDSSGEPNDVAFLRHDRPLNPYLDARIWHEAEHRVFRCPRDRGMHYAGSGEPVIWHLYGQNSYSQDGVESIYGMNGTSYAANWMMYREIGTPGLTFGHGDPGQPAPDYTERYGPDDVRVAPSRFPLIIDGGAQTAGWWPEERRRTLNMPVGWWHGFNLGYMSFLDGSAHGEEMGAPVTSGYSMFLDPDRHDY